MKRQIFLLSFTLFLILNPLPFLHAQWPTTPDSSLWPTTPDTGLVIGYGDFPLIASDEEGGAIVAFHANTPQEIKVKRVNRYGYSQWNGWNGVVAGGIESYQVLHDVAEDGEGGILVAFLDVREITFYEFFSFVTVQRIDHQGNRLWGEGTRVAVVDSVVQEEAQVFSDGQGGCIVGWLDSRNQIGPFPFPYDLYVQRIDSTGQRCWGDSALRITSSPTLQGKAIMAVNEQGETFLKWSMMQKLDLAGNKLWGQNGIPINQLPGQVKISDREGGFIFGGYLYTSGRYRLALQQIDSSGQKVWGEDGITLVDSVNFLRSGVTGMLFDDEGNILLSLYFARDNQWDAYLQKLDMNGVKLFGDSGIVVSNYPSTKAGRMIASENKLIYAWGDSRGGIYVQRFDTEGNRLWNEEVLFSIDGTTRIVSDSYGGIIMVYRGDSSSPFSINLTKMGKNGVIGDTTFTAIHPADANTIPSSFILYQNYPNPFNSSTIIPYRLVKSAEVELIIYNITGQKVKTVFKQHQLPRYYRIPLDMSGFSSGIYFYKLTAGRQSAVKRLLLIK